MISRPPILVIEDDQEWIDILSKYLQDDYEVSTAKTLVDAQLWLERKNFRLALVDISLVLYDAEDESGFQLIEELSTIEILRDMSLIIVTSYATPERVRKAFKEYRVHDFVDKGSLVPLEFKQTVAEAIAEAYFGTKPMDEDQ